MTGDVMFKLILRSSYLTTARGKSESPIQASAPPPCWFGVPTVGKNATWGKQLSYAMESGEWRCPTQSANPALNTLFFFLLYAVQIPAATTHSLHTHCCSLHYTQTILMEQIQDHQAELPLLPSPPHTGAHVAAVHTVNCNSSNDAVSLDLQLSISSTPTPASARAATSPASSDQAFGMGWYRGNVESMKRHAADQIRLAAADKAYAERVRELTRREMEAAESEFARATHVWERAHQEMEVAQKMKDKATTRVDPSCVEITCQSCRLRFRP